MNQAPSLLRVNESLGQLLEELFDDGFGVKTAIATGWRGDPEVLEEELDAGMVPARVREFSLGRACARAALARLDGPAAVIPRGKGGWPVWPDGFCGSISHASGVVAAAVVRTGPVVGLGIDVEEVMPHDDRRSRIFLTAEERSALAGWGDEPPCRWPAVLFSAKEAVFKAQSPERTVSLGLRDFSLVPTADGRGFETLPWDGPATSARFAVVGGVVLAGAVRVS